jgi:gamma-glutamyltranspeptidase/glutathione hydrolase
VDETNKLMYMKYFFGLLLFNCAFFLSCQERADNQTESMGELNHTSMVVSAHPLASKIGADIMKKGGNAYDAAIAVHFALAVVHPEAGNIGGGGFMVSRNANGDISSLDFRESAPAAANRNMYLNKSGEIIEDLSLDGHFAAGVPGSVAGMFAIHERYASMPMSELIQPAIDLARNGFALTKFEANSLNEHKDAFLKSNTVQPFLVRENNWNEDDSIKFTDLSNTLQRISELGLAGFYSGVTADLILAEMQRGGGVITQEDLNNYKVHWRKPVIGLYRDCKIISMPLPSSGGIALIQLLTGAENYDIAGLGHNTPQSIHLMTELTRRVYADRATFMGDIDFVEVPVEQLLSRDYINVKNADISMTAATPSVQIKEGNVQRIESFETTHFSVVDSIGNAVAITTTINSYFGNKVMVAGAGFFLNNEMDDFSVKPGVANQFGLVGSDANAIEPGKRMLSSMTPTIVEKNGKLLMVLGTPGGSTIITNVFQVILNVVDHEFELQQAVDAKKIHAQWLPDQIVFEAGLLNEADIVKLESMGHKLLEVPSIGRFAAIMTKESKLIGVADSSRPGDSSAAGN